MSHGPEQQIEHAEHAAHAAHDRFDRPVTISIAMVAAVLACVSMLGHRAHNETLRLQGEALHYQSQAGIKNTEAANKWAYYQSKNLFNFESKLMLDQMKVFTARDAPKADVEAVGQTYQGIVDKYDKKLPAIEEEARGIVEEAQKEREKADEKLRESHEAHLKSDRFDLGELGLQLGVVICSLAILTRSRAFWYGGLICAAAGTLWALTGYFGLFIEHH